MPRSARTTLSSALSVVVIAAGLAAVPTTASAEAPADFYSSFETGETQPTWNDTVETDAQGKQKAYGVNGANGTAIPGDIRGRVTETSASSENTSGEDSPMLVDGTADTKWLAWTPTAWAQITLSEPTSITHYAVTSANDAPERDPKDWALQGSNDALTWTDIDKQTGQSYSDRFQQKDYKLAAPTTAYKYFRFDVTRNNGGPIMQVAELLLANDDPAPPPLPTMRTFPDSGPTSGYTNKNRVGFTGLRAYRYSGSQTVTGHGWSYNKIFDVDIPVTTTTELSYKVQPQFIKDDLKYPSTNVAVDLAFTDGTYLSQLGAVDQYGFPLTPQGQGASKVLYTNQWNLVRSNIALAAGKTIDRILVGYDNPNGPGLLQGWLDDIKISATPTPPASQRPTDNVLTTRGTLANSTFSRGNNFPATAVPHGFNFWTPVTDAGSNSWLYNYHSGNNAQNLPTLQSFSASHEPSPWMGDRQSFQVMPSLATGVPDANREKRQLAFKHENETARAHYYGVQFENGIKTELAPTDHAALFRFTFPGTDANLIFDNVNNNGGLTLDTTGGTLSGYTDAKSGLSAGAGRMFVYATFDKPVTAGGKLPGEGRDNVRGYLRFNGQTVNMRIATSLISVDQAKKNLAQELAPTATLESVRDAAQKAWDEKLGVIEVEGASKDQLTTLYSNLYRLFLYPNSGHENTGTPAAPAYKYASFVSPKTGADTPTQTGSKIVDGQTYVNNGFWDTYRTTWPAYSLLTPDMAGKMIDGFVQQYRDGGWISRWSSPGYADLMTGTSSDVAFADAYLKGVKNFDVKSSYDAALRNATVTPPNNAVGRKGVDEGMFLGYAPNTADHGFSWSIEGYVNDFGIANLSKKLYDEAPATDPRKQEYLANYEYFTSRAQQYVNLFDPSVGFFQGRDATGKFSRDKAQYDPRVWGIDYTETDGWGMAFSVPQDGQGLANLYGGKEGLAKKLDAFFADQETAGFPGTYGGVIHEMREARDVRMGQLGHSNQASHHTMYMYDYAGQPSKTQAKVREALGRLYTGSEIGQGYAGDEDNGEQSAWWTFSALGFYPLQMGSPNYAIGSPLFTKATVHLAGGKNLVINAPKNSSKNIYVQGLRVNGKPYTSTSIPQDLIAKGGTLDFDMGPTPSKWGTGPHDAPPSITTGDAAPSPLHDLTGPGKGTATGADVDANAVTAIFDNTSRTESKVTAPIQYQLASTKEAATMYTLTSAKIPGDAKSWTLKGSYDGTNWAVADERTDQSFQWRQQTRAFKVTNPAHFKYYRLEVTATSGGTMSLAEFELLGKPDAVCSKTITGTHNGPLTVTGTVCLDNATVTGPVTVAPGATLIATGGSIGGPLSSANAQQVVLVGTKVGGPVSITGTKGTVSIEQADIGGPVTLTGNHGPVLTASSVGGPLACAANAPAPSDYALTNTVRGPSAGQCAKF
ncbi:alpha-1,2-mannosidase, putative [Amycolatopsis xylanica]|uniref:Alpha-1,2-mannosidase, putative n=1 Tax=Amycolatopsis xylanica TaxID=589385 RepID=A0A1H2VMI1_9PSEU|nr:GH92 family glycosyl hydrolase [Amycolatopsis xylanica]SDW69531.1 alpha-1,2-mannosidase, putative [Amycolatopsis xylanica]